MGLDKEITPRQSRLIFEKMDCNKNGKVTSDEFKKILSRLSSSCQILKSIKEEVKRCNYSQRIFGKVGISSDVDYLDNKQFEALVREITPEVLVSETRKLF